MNISDTMKKILLILGLLVSLTAAHVVMGQTTEGVITYEVKMNLHRRLPPEREGMKDMIPEFNIYKQQLVFNGSESLYKLVEEEEEDFQEEQPGGRRMMIRRPRAEHYTHQANSQRLTQQEFMGKKYLIEDSIKIQPWKLGTETRTVLGYVCRQATLTIEERKQTIVVWYTDKLRPFLGPETYNTLPGTVLMVDINNGERLITAMQVDARALKKGELKAPTAGQRITEKEFRTMMEEQMKRMGGPNGGPMIMRN